MNKSVGKLLAVIGLVGMNTLSYFWGPQDALLLGLFFFAIMDMVTGMGGALIKGTYDSSEFTLRKKIGIAIAVAVIYRIDQLFPTLQDVVPSFASWEQPLRDTVIAFFIVNEVASIFENLGAWGVSLPMWVRDRLIHLKDGFEAKQ